VGGVGERVRDFLADADSASSVAATLRARRWRTFLELFPDLGEMRVIDLGGTANYWAAAPVRPAHVLVVNLEEQKVDEPWMSSVVGDVCQLGPELADERYDLVYSNSVIEHVGGHARRQDMADNIHRLSDRHWVQTPYRYFPIEPHWLFPGFQFLPAWLATKVSMHWPLLWSRPPDERTAMSGAMSVELLDRTQFGFYFPDSQVLSERVVGLTKSLIATS
jgi:Methyltransferase domain